MMPVASYDTTPTGHGTPNSVRTKREASRGAPGRARIVRDLGLVDWYRIPVWYDVLHEKGTAAEVDGLERIALRYSTTKPRAHGPVWYEPACGTGRFLRVASARGVRTVGTDLSEEMIEYARSRFAARGLSGTFIAADMTTHACTPKADLAFCTVNTIRHLPTDRAVLDHLDAVARSLRAGGVYAVGINTTVYGGEMASEDVWTGARGTLRITQVANYLPAPASGLKSGASERFETVINHLTALTPATETHADNRYQLRCYSTGEWRKVLAKSPFRVLAATDEFGTELASGEDAFGVPGYAVWVLGLR